MKNKVKRIFASLLLLSIFINSFMIASFAKDESERQLYEETHDQINFDYLTVGIVNESLIVEVDPTISVLKRKEAKKQMEKFEKLSKESPEIVSELKDSIKSNEFICAISYTDAPLVYVDDHFERVLANKRTSKGVVPSYSTSAASISGNLKLWTRVGRSGSSNPYTYTATTFGEWNNSATGLWGGENSPGAGYDFILQSCPNTVSSDSFSSTYNYSTSGSTNGQEGINFRRSGGNNSWVQYDVVDDPVGIAQLKTFSLVQKFKAKATSRTKKIKSYYVHTWKKMTISVAVNGTAGKSGGEPAASVGLTITPSVVEKQWKLYNYVSYDW